MQRQLQKTVRTTTPTRHREARRQEHDALTEQILRDSRYAVARARIAVQAAENFLADSAHEVTV